jgi:hypothetical protein
MVYTVSMKTLASVTASLVLLGAGVSLVYAQTSTTTTQAQVSIQSDFAKDLQDGERETANDEEAHKNQHEISNNENVGVNEEGEARNGQEGIDHEDLTQSKNDLNHEGERDDSATSTLNGGHASEHNTHHESGGDVHESHSDATLSGGHTSENKTHHESGGDVHESYSGTTTEISGHNQ